MFKLYVTASMITGEAIRCIAAKNNITARSISISIGMSEGNFSRFLSNGMGYKRNIDKVLTAINSTHQELNSYVNAINEICENNNLQIKNFVSEEQKDILIRNTELQKVINIELKDYML